MSIKNNKQSQWLFLLLLVMALIIAALFPRYIGFAEVPPSLSWDEAAVGVNGLSIINKGVDEWGFSFPITFYSFGDDKNPIHIYLTALSIGLFGLSEFSIRLPVLIFGVLNVVLLFLVGNIMFRSKVVGFLAALSLAFSPYNIIFSHFNHELNFTIFFFLLGLLLFYLGLKKNGWLLFLSFICFSIDLLTYNSAKVIVPVIVAVLIGLYIKDLIIKMSFFIPACIIFGLSIALIITNPHLSGSSRAEQNNYTEGEIKNTTYYEQTNNLLLARLYLTYDQYRSHFSQEYLFSTGDKNVRHSTQKFGEFYQFELILMIMGFLIILYLRNKVSVLLLIWLLIAPIPSALFKEAPHSARAMFMNGSMHLLIGMGGYLLLRSLLYIKEKKLHFVFPNLFVILVGIVLISALYLSQLSKFLVYYQNDYTKRYAIDWQYGMKQVVEYTKSRSDLQRVYVTDSRSQPYIFFRLYEPIDTEIFLNSAVLDDSDQKPSNIVERYDKYIFGRWDKINSIPTKGILYVLTPSEYSGLLHRNEFEVKKLIKYPNETDAFYLVEGNR